MARSNNASVDTNLRAPVCVSSASVGSSCRRSPVLSDQVASVDLSDRHLVRSQFCSVAQKKKLPLQIIINSY